jgi:hypothetical protein
VGAAATLEDAVLGLEDAVLGLVGISEVQAAIITILLTPSATRLRYRWFDILASLGLRQVKPTILASYPVTRKTATQRLRSP